MAVDRFMRYAALLWLATLPGTSGDGGVHQVWTPRQADSLYPIVGEVQKSMDEERRERVGRDFLVYFNYTVMTRIVVWVLFGALLYDLKATTPLRTEMRQQSRDSSSQNNFAFGLCECCHHCETSCWAIWCPCALWSATASSPKSNFGGWSFWQLTFLWVGFYLLSGTAGAMEAFLEILPALSLPLLLIRICIQVWHRQHLRKKCDLDHGNCCTLTEDACVWCFCTQCAAMQEALQVGFVEGMPLTAPLTDGHPPPSQQELVGAVVRVDGRQASWYHFGKRVLYVDPFL